MIISKLKNLFKKEELFECIVWDGKTMKYLDLNKQQIDDIENLPEYKEWSVTIKSEC